MASEYLARLTNDSCFFDCIDEESKDNTYLTIYKNNTIRNNMGHNLSGTAETVISIIYNSRSRQLYMKPDVIKSIRRLQDIEKLEKDWNGYGANCFSGELIDKCEKIVGNLPVQPAIYPTGRNSIQFQYELADRSYLEFEVFERKIACLEVPKRIYSDAVELTITDSEELRVREIVEKFYGRNCTVK